MNDFELNDTFDNFSFTTADNVARYEGRVVKLQFNKEANITFDDSIFLSASKTFSGYVDSNLNLEEGHTNNCSSSTDTRSKDLKENRSTHVSDINNISDLSDFSFSENPTNEENAESNNKNSGSSSVSSITSDKEEEEKNQSGEYNNLNCGLLSDENESYCNSINNSNIDTSSELALSGMHERDDVLINLISEKSKQPSEAISIKSKPVQLNNSEQLIQQFNSVDNVASIKPINEKPYSLDDEDDILCKSNSDELKEKYNLSDNDNVLFQSNAEELHNSVKSNSEEKYVSKSLEILSESNASINTINSSIEDLNLPEDGGFKGLSTDLSSWGLPGVILQKYEDKKIKQMFQWQVDCLMKPGVLDAHKNLVYSAPTSAGKTLVAEILAIKTVLERKKKVIFILPFVSVVREKMFYFKDILGTSGVRVEGFMGSYNPPGGFRKVNVAICTIEKANSLVNRLLDEGGLEEIGAVVVDEMHLLGDSSRGYLLELLLTKLRYMSMKEEGVKIQIIGMSATLPNLNLLADWLGAELFTTDFRPIPLHEQLIVQGEVYDNKFSLQRKLTQLPELQTDTDNVLQLCLETIGCSCSVLIFCSSKNWCESLAQQISAAFFKIGSSKTEMGAELRNQLNSESIMECLEQLKRCPVGLDAVLAKTVSFGVAYHHAGLTIDERDILEGAFKSGSVRVLVATSTLSSGVNLPARRVLIRSPMFNGKPLDTLTYRQMIGRAGRMGKDTEGESLLICQKNDYKVAKELMSGNLRPVESCLEGAGKLKRAILEVITSDVASSPEEIELFTKCTLLASDPNRESEINDPIKDSLTFLIDNEFIRLQGDQLKYIATSLAKACLSSSMPPEEGLALFTELEKARQCFVLETELHLIYLVTPYSACNQFGNLDWMAYLEMWEKLPASMKRVGELVGVRVSYILSGTRGKIQTNTSKLYHKLQVHKRFYTALALQDLVNEIPLNTVAAKFGCNRGMLQALQQSAATFAGMVTSFSKQLGWSSVELLVSQFQDRLQFGISRELLDLMKMPLLNGQRARILYNAGIESLIDLANTDVFTLENILCKAKPFETEKEREGETAYDADKRNKLRTVWVTGKQCLTEREAAEMLVQDARVYLQLELGLKEAHWEDEQRKTKKKRAKREEEPDSSDSEHGEKDVDAGNGRRISRSERIEDCDEDVGSNAERNGGEGDGNIKYNIKVRKGTRRANKINVNRDEDKVTTIDKEDLDEIVSKSSSSSNKVINNEGSTRKNKISSNAKEIASKPLQTNDMKRTSLESNDKNKKCAEDLEEIVTKTNSSSNKVINNKGSTRKNKLSSNVKENASKPLQKDDMKRTSLESKDKNKKYASDGIQNLKQIQNVRSSETKGENNKTSDNEKRNVIGRVSKEITKALINPDNVIKQEPTSFNKNNRKETRGVLENFEVNHDKAKDSLQQIKTRQDIKSKLTFEVKNEKFQKDNLISNENQSISNNDTNRKLHKSKKSGNKNDLNICNQNVVKAIKVERLNKSVKTKHIEEKLSISDDDLYSDLEFDIKDFEDEMEEHIEKQKQPNNFDENVKIECDDDDSELENYDLQRKPILQKVTSKRRSFLDKTCMEQLDIRQNSPKHNMKNEAQKDSPRKVTKGVVRGRRSEVIQTNKREVNAPPTLRSSKRVSNCELNESKKKCVTAKSGKKNEIKHSNQNNVNSKVNQSNGIEINAEKSNVQKQLNNAHGSNSDNSGNKKVISIDIENEELEISINSSISLNISTTETNSREISISSNYQSKRGNISDQSLFEDSFEMNSKVMHNISDIERRDEHPNKQMKPETVACSKTCFNKSKVNKIVEDKNTIVSDNVDVENNFILKEISLGDFGSQFESQLLNIGNFEKQLDCKSNKGKVLENRETKPVKSNNVLCNDSLDFDSNLLEDISRLERQNNLQISKIEKENSKLAQSSKNLSKTNKTAESTSALNSKRVLVNKPVYSKVDTTKFDTITNSEKIIPSSKLDTNNDLIKQKPFIESSSSKYDRNKNTMKIISKPEASTFDTNSNVRETSNQQTPQKLHHPELIKNALRGSNAVTNPTLVENVPESIRKSRQTNEVKMQKSKAEIIEITNTKTKEIVNKQSCDYDENLDLINTSTGSEEEMAKSKKRTRCAQSEDFSQIECSPMKKPKYAKARTQRSSSLTIDKTFVISSDKNSITNSYATIREEEECVDLTKFEIIDVCGNVKLFNCFKTELLNEKEFAVSLGCERFAQVKPLIGIKKSDDKIEGGFVWKDVRLNGLAFCFGSNVAYFVNLNGGVVSREDRVGLLKTLFEEVNLRRARIYDAKEQIWYLKQCAAVEFNCLCDDPKIADWLLEPEGKEKSLRSMTATYAPEGVKLCEMAGNSKGVGSLGLEINSTIDSRIRCSIESILTWNLMSPLKNMLNEREWDLLHTYDIETNCLIILAKIELTGFGVNMKELQNLADQVNSYTNAVEAKAFELAGRRFSFIRSTDVAKVLGIYKGKRINTNKKVLHKTETPLSNLILLWRRLNSALTKMVQPLLRLVENQRIHGRHITHSATGRISMQEPNLQNMPRDFEFEHPQSREKVVLMCRRAFCAKEKNVLISADYCQLELRLLAHFSQDKVLCEIMRRDEDVFQLIAAKWNNISRNDVTEVIRRQTKQICYGIIYGMGNRTLADQLCVEEEEAMEFTETFHRKYPGIKQFINVTVAQCQEMGYVQTIGGRRRYLSHINDINPAVKSQAERQAVNTMIQGSAADIVKNVMTLIDNKVRDKFKSSRNKPKMVLHLHDELIYEVPLKYQEIFSKLLKRCMQDTVKLSIPFPVKVKTGPNWSDMKDYSI